MYDKILVPYGGTKASDAAIEHAINIAKKFSSTITILHVVEPVPSVYAVSLFQDAKEEFVREAQEITETLKSKMKEQLKEKITRFKEDFKIKLDVIEGEPAKEILDYAKENNFNLIIMPKRRITGLKSLLNLGSTSRRVIEHSTCPVMVVEV